MMEKWTGVEKEVLYLYFSTGGHLTLDPTIKKQWVETLNCLRRDLDDGLGQRLSALLTRREVRQTRLRVDRLLSTKRHPEPGGEWPPVPWPPI